MSASDEAAAFLTDRAAPRKSDGKSLPATGEYARLRELVLADDLDDDEAEELHELQARYRRGELGGKPKRTVHRRESVAGEMYEGKAPKPLTASELAAREIRGV